MLDVKFLANFKIPLSNVVCSLKETGSCPGISWINHRANETTTEVPTSVWMEFPAVLQATS